MNGMYDTAQWMVNVAAVAGVLLSFAGVLDYLRQRRVEERMTRETHTGRVPVRRVEAKRRKSADAV